MSLKQANMVKRITASGGGSLEAKTGESLRVKRIEVVPSANDTYITVSVDRVTVGFYRVKGKSGNHLGTLHGAYLKGNIMGFLAQNGVNVSIPIASGQTLNITRYAEAGNVMVVYDRFDEGDIKETDPNGSQCKEYTFLQYAKIGATPAAAGDFKIDTSLTPAEFPDFPCGAVVPPGYTMDLVGIAGAPFVHGIATPGTLGSKFLKLIKGREVLFDIDRNGLPFDGDNAAAVADAYVGNFSLVGPGTEVLVDTNIVTPGDPLMFIPAISFIAGDELNAYITLALSGVPTWPTAIVDIAFILKVKRM